MNIKHKNLIEKLDLLVCDDFHPNYVSILIITTILLITTTFFHLIDIHNVDTLILITGIFIGIVLSLPLPLTYIRKIMLLFLINTVLGIIGVSETVYRVISVMLAITLGATYYPLYKWHIKRKIEKYKRKGLTYAAQLDIARKHGGDKFTVGVVLMFIALIALYIIFNYIMNVILLIVHS